MSIQKILLCDLSRGRNWRNWKRWDKRGSKRPWPPWWLVSRFLGEKRKMDRAQIDHKKFAQWRIDIQIKARIWKKTFSPFNSHLKNICCWYSKEPSRWDGPFERPKHMLNIGEKNISIYAYKKFPELELWIAVALRKFKIVFSWHRCIIFWLVHKIFLPTIDFRIYSKFYRNLASTYEIMKRFALSYWLVKWLW